MKSPVVIFGLLSVVFWLALEVRLLLQPRFMNEKGTWKMAVQDTICMLALLGVAALISIAFGKPGLAPQYAAWVAIPLQALRAWSIARDKMKVASVFGILVLLGVGVVWLWQTPWFGPNALP